MLDRQGNKRGPNETCWCVSGRKYKHCHMRRDKLLQTGYLHPVDAREALQHAKNFLQQNNRRPACFCPPAFRSECSDRIVKAHTISRSSALDLISERDRVSTFVTPINPGMIPDDPDQMDS